MGARIRIPLWVLLPGLAVGVVALGVIAAGAVGISGTREYLTRQADGTLLACAGEMLSQGFVAGPTSGLAPPGSCDTELLNANGQLLTPPAPGAGLGPAIPADRSWLAAHMARPVTVPGVGGNWRVLLETVHYQPQRIMFIGGPEDLQYVISGRAARGPAGLLVVMSGLAGVDRLTGRVAAGYVAAAGAVLVLLGVAGLTVTWAVLRPLRQAGSGGAMSTRGQWSQRAFVTALTRISEQLAASRAREAAADRSVAEMTGRLRDVSQELRTSVSIVRGFAEHYRHRGKPLPAAGDPMMRRVADEITRMETLIAQLDVEDPTSAEMPRDP